MMHDEFETSMMMEFQYFIWLQIYQSKKDTFINQAKYCNDSLKILCMKKEKSISTPMSMLCSLDKDKGGKTIEERKY